MRPSNMKRLLPLLLVALFLLAACAPLARPLPAPVLIPTQEQGERQAQETPTIAATATPQPAPTDTPIPEPTPVPVIQPSLPAPTLFGVDWDDRSPFATGLIASEQDALEERPGASVYHIQVSISDDLTNLQGREEVRYTNTEDVPLDEIHFRLFPNFTGGSAEITGLTVNGEPAEPAYALEGSDMIVPMSEALQPGDQVVIAMNFDVEVPTEPGGNYGTFSMLDDVLLGAHFYPMIPVYNEEGWNVELAPDQGDIVFSDTSYYLVEVDAPEEQILLASGVEVGREEQDGRQVVTYAAGPMRDFYLTASDRYEVVSKDFGETTLNVYAPAEDDAQHELALRYASDAFESFSERIGDYPFTELDVAGIPPLPGAGGVEYPGIVVVVVPEDPNEQFFEIATAHEVGHQWFYSVVGNDQVDEPWLDESLTQYITLLYFDDVYGESGYEAIRNGDMQRRWDYIDDADIPIGLPVAAYQGTYSGIIYGRGALFFEALADALDDEQLRAFLPDYYETFKWDIVTTEDFKALAEQHCGCDLTDLFEEWVY